MKQQKQPWTRQEISNKAEILVEKEKIANN